MLLDARERNPALMAGVAVACRDVLLVPASIGRDNTPLDIEDGGGLRQLVQQDRKKGEHTIDASWWRDGRQAASREEQRAGSFCDPPGGDNGSFDLIPTRLIPYRVHPRLSRKASWVK
jgi:hypothetical protein